MNSGGTGESSVFRYQFGIEACPFRTAERKGSRISTETRSSGSLHASCRTGIGEHPAGKNLPARTHGQAARTLPGISFPTGPGWKIFPAPAFLGRGHAGSLGTHAGNHRLDGLPHTGFAARRQRPETGLSGICNRRSAAGGRREALRTEGSRNFRPIKFRRFESISSQVRMSGSGDRRWRGFFRRRFLSTRLAQEKSSFKHNGYADFRAAFLDLNDFVCRVVQQTSGSLQSAAGTCGNAGSNSRGNSRPGPGTCSSFRHPGTGHQTARPRGCPLLDQAGNDIHRRRNDRGSRRRGGQGFVPAREWKNPGGIQRVSAEPAAQIRA